MSKKELKPELLTVGKLFTDNYLIPIYQRNYAWRAEQIEQLISDIQDSVVGGQDDYFLGNLVVIKRGREDEFEVIDGQQRLTTLYLLLTFLELNGEGEKPSVGHAGHLQYESRARATEALRRVAQEAAKEHVRPQGYTSNADAGIHEGYSIINQFFKQNETLNRSREKFSDFLLTKVTVVRVSLPPNTDLNRYFEIMNTRGQQLKQVDIVKARLMSKLPNQYERECFAWVWDACADMDSYVQMSLTRGDTSLRNKVFGDEWSWLEVTSFASLMESRPQSGTNSSRQSSEGVSLSLDEALSKYAKEIKSNSTEDEGNERFRSTIEFPAFLLHVLRIMKGDEVEDEGQLDDKRLIKSFDDAVNNVPDAKADWVRSFAFMLLKCRNLFDGFILKRQFTANIGDDGDWSLQRLKKSGADKKLTPTYIHVFSASNGNLEEDGGADPHTRDVLLLQSMLRITYTSPRTMHWITKVLRWLSVKAPQDAKHADLADLLKGYARSKVKETFPFEEDQQPQGFGISRIVFSYLDYLLLSDSSKRDFKFQFRTSIEHFYPQHPDKEQSGAVVSGSSLNLLGNLALVSVSANSKFSNSLPKAKAENFKDTIELQSPKLKRMAEITRNTSWDDQQITAHHEEMVTLLRDDVSLVEASGRSYPGR
ncbi:MULTISPECIES: DUF262 domain-containing protein [Kluyvera]|uniref:DUF262 domain-containing protein n=1 Tax=Kluyvera sichuanensis TaxID=2725494 RepID=A0ABR6RW65_9ENTR|nr:MULTISPECIES: DUF262 domain-containing protein [Kluyvera]MBC1187326.1 DUF262 domain-containing protein [Kluyvera sichuanensis]MBW9459993.1 DUF262 domain-containing protein [Kluyvera sp. EC_51]